MSLRSALAIADCLEPSLPRIQASACIQEFPGVSHKKKRLISLSAHCSLQYFIYQIIDKEKYKACIE